MTVRALAACVLASWVLGGCDAVGQALVDYEQPSELGVPAVACSMAPECTTPPGIRDNLSTYAAHALQPRAHASCGVLDCPDAFAQAQLEDDAGARFGDCEPSAPGAAWLPQALVALDDEMSASCVDFSITDVLADADGVIRLDAVSWRDVNVQIQSSVPLRVELTDARLAGAFVEMIGPVTLRIEHALELSEVSVTSEHALSRVELERSDGAGIGLGEPGRHFGGSAMVKLGTLTGSQLMAKQLSLESMHIEDGIVAADSLSAADTQLGHVLLEVTDAVFSASRLRNTTVRGCARLTALGSWLAEVDLAACSELTRIYGSTVSASVVDGVVESDVTTWGGTLLGLREHTELLVWSGRMSGGRACAHAQSIRLGAMALLSCMACEPETFAQPGAACVLLGEEAELRANLCPNVREPLPVCLGPSPERLRPLEAPF